MNLNDVDAYDYFLPADLIANEPVMPQESARLLVYEREKDLITHAHFGDLPQILPDCDIIFNDTKVVKARIFGHKESGGKVELLLNRPINDNYSVFIRGSVKIGTKLKFDENLECEVVELLNDGSRIVKFAQNGAQISDEKIYGILDSIGHMPLPPYIKRSDKAEDESWYQTIFAKNLGAVAAPTASLHISQNLLRELKKRHEIHYITLHVGAGTFKPVEAKDIREHKMHSEFYEISEKVAKILDGKKRILGVGTTVTRTVENFVRTHQLKGFCEIFLNLNNPPIRQDFLLTNFHLPKSTLIMLVSAFIGLEKTMEIYKTAVDERYRFYSYGDGMLII